MTRSTFNKRHPQQIADLYDQAECQKAKGGYAEAEKLYHAALAALVPDRAHSALVTSQSDEAVPKDDSNRRIRLIELRVLASVGDLYRLQGRYGKSQRLLQAVVTACEKLAGPSDPQTAAVLINLGVVCKYLGRYREAEDHYLRALRILKRGRPGGVGGLSPQGPANSSCTSTLERIENPSVTHWGACPQTPRGTKPRLPSDDQPQLWPLLYNLGGIAHAQGQYAKGEQFARRALKLAEQVHGHNHPNVAVAMSNLAANLEGLGRDEEARSLYQRSVEIVKTAYGPWHRDVAMNLNNLAALLQRRGDCSQAEALYRQAVQIKRRALGSKHADVAVTFNNLGCLYHFQGRHHEAVPLFLQALRIFRATFAPDHPKLLAIRKNIRRLKLAMAADT